VSKRHSGVPALPVDDKVRRDAAVELGNMDTRSVNHYVVKLMVQKKVMIKKKTNADSIAKS